jgi:hypothetical protein
MCQAIRIIGYTGNGDGMKKRMSTSLLQNALQGAAPLKYWYCSWTVKVRSFQKLKSLAATYLIRD